MSLGGTTFRLAGQVCSPHPSSPEASAVELCRIVLENRIPENLIQVAVILDDLRDTRFETIKHIVGFRPADNLFIR